MSFVEETAVMQGIHVAVHGKCDQVAPIRQIGQGGYWIQVCHDDNLINKAASRGHSGKSYDDIRERFVIDGV